jgi:hypothetical protein
MTMQTQTLRVQPGDVIASALMNQVLDRLDGLTTRLNGVGLQLGPLAVQTHTLVALGSGFDTGGIFMDGQALLQGQPQRGINLVILDSNLQVKFRAAYDTLGGAVPATQLATDIAAHTAHLDIVVGVTHDAYVPGSATPLPEPARTALASIGAYSLGRPDRGRDNAAFIGVVPANRTNVTFDYLVSIIPADDSGFGSGTLAAPPFVWGVYSVPLHRFLLGGGAVPETWTSVGVAATQTQTQTQPVAPAPAPARPVAVGPIIVTPPAPVLPIVFSAGGLRIVSMSFSPNPVGANATSTGTVTLSAAVPRGGVTVALSSADPGTVTVPQDVVVAAEQTTATFQANALKAGSAVIAATLPGGAPTRATLVVSG